jgi:hypothetical protein
MVQNLSSACAVEVNPSSEPALFRDCKATNSKNCELWFEIVNREVLSSAVGEKVCRLVEQKLYLLQKYSRKLAQIDERVKNITKSFEDFPQGIEFEELNDRGFVPNDKNQRLIFNISTISCIAQKVPREWLHMAILVFLFHEVSHISQKVKFHEDVQRIKAVDRDYGRNRLMELDLSSDFLAVHTLSLLLTLHDKKEYNRKVYIEWFYKTWRKVCGQMLDVFSVGKRQDKQRRVFGALLMSNLIRDAYVSNYPLEFEAELIPKWSANLDKLSIYSEGCPLIANSCVDPRLMSQAIDYISTGEFDAAASFIAKIWRTLPRR